MGVQHYRSYEAFLLGSHSSLVVFKAVVKYVGGFWPIGVFFAGYRSFFFVPTLPLQSSLFLSCQGEMAF